MDWFISSEPTEPLAQYLIPLPAKANEDRAAYTAIDLNRVVRDNRFNIYQKWFVRVYLNDVFVKEISFHIKQNNYQDKSVQSYGSRKVDIGV